MGTPILETNNTQGHFLVIASTGQDVGDLITGAAPETGPLVTNNATNSTTPLTGAILQTSGTSATSVGIGQGNLNAGGSGTFGGKVAVGTNTTSQTLTIADAASPIFELKRGATSVGFIANGSAVLSGGVLDLGIDANAAGSAVLIGNGGVIGLNVKDAVVNATGTTEASSPTVGTLLTAGGFGVAKRSFLGTIGSSFVGNVIAGVQTAQAAVAGQVGEVLSNVVSTYTNFTTTATYQQCATITLTAGDWDVRAILTVSVNGSVMTAGANTIMAVGTTTASAAGTTEGQTIVYADQNTTSGDRQTIELGFPIQVSASTPYFLNAQATFTAGNPQFACSIVARRMR